MKKQSELNTIKSICTNTNTSHPAQMLFEVKQDEVYLTAGNRISLTEDKKKEQIKTIWRDLHGELIFSNKSKTSFQFWLEWVANIDDFQVSLLSDKDKAVREQLLEQKQDPNKIFTRPKMSEQKQEQALEIKIFTLFLERGFNDKFLDLISTYLQGTGVVTSHLWGFYLLHSNFKDGLTQVDIKRSSQIYQYDGHLYGRAIASPIIFSRDYKEFKSIPIPPYGAVEIDSQGLKILDTGGIAKVTELLLNKQPDNFGIDLKQFEDLVESEKDSLENEFKNIKQELISNYKKLSADRVSDQIFYTIELLIKNLDNFKDLPNLTLASYNKSLQEINKFISSPRKTSEPIIQDKISHLYHLLIMQKQKTLCDNFIAKFSKLAPDHPLKQKFGLINFKYLDEIISSPNAKFFNLPEVIDNLNKVIEKSSTEEKLSEESEINSYFEDSLRKLENIYQIINVSPPLLAAFKKLEWCYNKYKPATGNNITVEIFNDIRLLIKSIDKIKNLPENSKNSLLGHINTICVFLKNPLNNAEKIKNHVSDFHKLIFNSQLEGFSQIHSDLEKKPPFQNKFKNIHAQLKKMTERPNANYFNLSGLMEDFRLKLDELREEKATDYKFSRITSEIENPEVGMIYHRYKKTIVSNETSTDEEGNISESIYTEEAIEYTLRTPNGTVITDKILREELPNSENPEKSILKILASRGHVQNNLENHLDETLEKLKSIDLQMQKDLQMEGHKHLRNIVDDCFEQCRQELEKSKSDITTQNLDAYWDCLRVVFSKKDPEKYAEAVLAIVRNPGDSKTLNKIFGNINNMDITPILKNIRHNSEIGDILQRALQRNYPDFSKKFKINLAPPTSERHWYSDFFKKNSALAHKPAQPSARSIISALI